MDGESLNIQQTKLNELKQHFPELFSEEKLDWEKLKAAFGEDINFNNERYVLNWAGKADAFKCLQIPTTATLKPVSEESINFDTTQNVFIEGENLEVLKVLQKSYYGKVKCIIIDPPYNTGSDSFIYPDSFKENKKEYEKRVGDKDEEGYLTKQGLFRKNSKDSGHFHSNWLSMMYPRLFLAKNLLKEDGVIFVHIDDNEVHNLRLLMNEIFGEENFESMTTWRRRHNQPNDKSKMIAKVAEYILVYSKNSNKLKENGTYYGLPLTEDRKADYVNPDNDKNGAWSSNPWKAAVGRGGSQYKLVTPTGVEHDAIWYGNEDTFNDYLKHGRVHWTDGGNGFPRIKIYLKEAIKNGQSAVNFLGHERFGSNQEASAELESLFNKEGLFDNPKPIRLLKSLLSISTSENDIVLDFFAGSGSTAQAVLEQNKEDKLNRKFILVQLPELIDEKSIAFQIGCRTIADLSKERIKNSILKIKKQKEEDPDLFDNNTLDLGLKILKLDASNFKVWQTDDINEENLVIQLDAFTNPTHEDSKEQNMLFELMLKSGYQLTDKTEVKNKYYSINDNELVIVLEEISKTLIDEILTTKPQKVLMLDNLFKGDDQLKTNTVLQMRYAGIEFKTI
ncbi:site-specific DNA-methyltransferase [Mucilaginibacter corticis]|uniref:site-specific DNA-methyltransferase (adenine-specific) n=1 Tax=Mucilaginibacter corticis TaxID=2597670 RepID=A0A556MXR7_9SPHI|nr:site-specific DNA-methyltransferase [Mucilaginibacter corticis]TSJ44687.1 site-specific DNA-methyltransferase [Mucilaginibacter corticis]